MEENVSAKDLSAEVPSYEYLRELLIEADGKVSSRRVLAEQLHVSTHTIQNIINGEELPDLMAPGTSKRRRYAWTRTITRIALALNKDPWELLDSVGIERNNAIQKIVQSLTDNNHAISDEETATPVDLLARGLLLSMRSNGTQGKNLEKALERYLRSHKTSPQRAGHEQLMAGEFCRSCMTSLEDRQNRGKSEELCKWCSDENGKLLPRNQILEIMTHWFMQWQTGIDIDEARRRADLYMQSMPAWAGSINS